METCIEDFWLNFSLRDNAAKDAAQNKMVARYVSSTNRIQQILTEKLI